MMDILTDGTWNARYFYREQIPVFMQTHAFSLSLTHTYTHTHLRALGINQRAQWCVMQAKLFLEWKLIAEQTS